MLIGVLAFFLGLWAVVDPEDTTANVLGIVFIVVGILLAGSSLWMRLQLDHPDNDRGRDLAP